MRSSTNRYYRMLAGLVLCLVALCAWHLVAGQIPISWSEILHAWGDSSGETNSLIIRELRIPRMTMAMLSGAALSLAGMLMQTLFANPLAGPYVLGISSGSSLFVAFSVMTGFSFFSSSVGLISGAFLGAMAFGAIILMFSLFVRSQITLLLIGLMIGSFTGSIITVLETLSPAQELKSFTLWTMGSLQQTRTEQLPLILAVFAVAVSGSLWLIKPLNILVLGESAASQLGVNLTRIRVLTISVTALLTGLITAFCGPIAFVGLAVPNISRIIMRTQDHGKLLLTNILLGAIFMLLVDILIQVLEPYMVLPVNVLTSIIGAPIVILILLKRLK